MVSWTLERGQYNWAVEEDVWCLTLETPYGTVSEIFPDKPEVDPEKTTPSEVLDLIEERLDSYLFATGRTERKARIAKIRKHAHEIDTTWLDQQIEKLDNKLNTLRSRK